MKVGIVRRIDELGRIVIPVDIRRALGIANGDPLEIHCEEDHLVVRPYVDTTEGYESMLTRMIRTMESDTKTFKRDDSVLVVLRVAARRLKERREAAK